METEEWSPTSLLLSVHSAGFCLIHVHNLRFNRLHFLHCTIPEISLMLCKTFTKHLFPICASELVCMLLFTLLLFFVCVLWRLANQLILHIRHLLEWSAEHWCLEKRKNKNYINRSTLKSCFLKLNRYLLEICSF